MQTIEVINKTREYLDYVEEHVKNVQKAWGELQEKCKDMRFVYDDYVWGMIDGAIKEHDLSKLSKYEFVQYRECFYPCDGEAKKELGDAWEHHKEENPHHWENWIENDDPNDPYTWEVNCVHMVADWTAMGYKFGDTAKEYYEKNKHKIDLPDYAEDFIYEIFKRLEGDDPGRHETTPGDLRR